MRTLLFLTFLTLSALGSERIFIGTIHQGDFNEVSWSKNDQGQVTLTVGNVVEWHEESDEEFVSKFIPELTLEKRSFYFEEQKVAEYGFFRNSNLDIFNNDKVSIFSEKEKYCSESIDGDCVAIDHRFNIFLEISL